MRKCFASNTYFCNMVFQVQITNFSGEGGGIDFRASFDNNGSRGYTFMLKPEGAYDLWTAYDDVTVIPYTITSLPAVHTGYNVSNVITIIARDSTLYFYVNGQYLTNASDNSEACGEIGLLALDWTSPVSATFSNAKV